MPTVQDLLTLKGRQVHTISPLVTVLDATQLMNRNKIGALVVMDDQRLAGIFTERDVLTRVVACMRRPEQTTIAEVMTRKVFCCRADDDINELVTLMADKRVRHIPVCNDKGDVLGLISIGDLNAHFASLQQSEILYLNEFIHGPA